MVSLVVTTCMGRLITADSDADVGVLVPVLVFSEPSPGLLPAVTAVAPPVTPSVFHYRIDSAQGAPHVQ